MHSLITLVSDREQNGNRKSHVEQNDRLNMSLLKENCCAHRVQFRSRFPWFLHFRTRARVAVLTAECQTKNPLSIVQNVRSLPTLISPHTTRTLRSPAAFRLRNQQQQQSSYVGASQTLGSERSGAEPPREEIACAGRFLGTQHGRPRHRPRGSRGAPRPRRDGTRSLLVGLGRQLHQLSPTQLVVWRSETGLPPPPPQW